MATVNEDSAGVYRCRPVNSYGSMGSSEATRVLLQVSTHGGRGRCRLRAQLQKSCFRVNLAFSVKENMK